MCSSDLSANGRGSGSTLRRSRLSTTTSSAGRAAESSESGGSSRQNPGQGAAVSTSVKRRRTDTSDANRSMNSIRVRLSIVIRTDVSPSGVVASSIPPSYPRWPRSCMAPAGGDALPVPAEVASEGKRARYPRSPGRPSSSCRTSAKPRFPRRGRRVTAADGRLSADGARGTRVGKHRRAQGVRKSALLGDDTHRALGVLVAAQLVIPELPVEQPVDLVATDRVRYLRVGARGRQIPIRAISASIAWSCRAVAASSPSRSRRAKKDFGSAVSAASGPK